MKKMLIFLFGAAVGSASTYFLVKGKFEQEALDAINEEREYYRKKCSELSQSKPYISAPSEDKKEKEELLKEEAEKIISNMEYSRKEESNMSSINTEPYAINIDEFSTLNGYSKETLTMYPDDILADENYELVDAGDTVGFDMIDQLPEYENAEIYIRNDKRKIDYTLVRETHPYEEITGIFIGGYRSDFDDE